MPLVRRGGKFLTVGGKLATSEDCCCGCPIVTFSGIIFDCACADSGTWDFTSLGSQTSGTLDIGQIYLIDDFHAGDDFTNVGAASNTTGIVFVATGTTPASWSNGSVVLHINMLGDGFVEMRPGNFTDSPVTLTEHTFGHDCDPLCAKTAAEPHLHVFVYGPVNCDTLLLEADTPVFVAASRLEGVWHIMAWGADGIFFYGTTSSTSIPANNEVVCTLSPETWDTPLITCIFGGPIDFTGLARDGTAAL